MTESHRQLARDLCAHSSLLADLARTVLVGDRLGLEFVRDSLIDLLMDLASTAKLADTALLGTQLEASVAMLSRDAALIEDGKRHMETGGTR